MEKTHKDNVAAVSTVKKKTGQAEHTQNTFAIPKGDSHWGGGSLVTH